MTVYDGKYCDFCCSSIVGGQRWVRQKIYNPNLDGRNANYHHYHAEPFAGESESCWEKHQMEQETAQTTPVPLRGHSERLENKHVLVFI